MGIIGNLESWVMDTARGRKVREESAIQSEWPAHSTSGVASGYRTPASASCSILMSVPSSRWFKPRMLIVDNENIAQNRINLYLYGSATDASASIFGLWVEQRVTEFIALDGLTVGGDIWVSCLLASCHVRIAGILLASGPEN